MNPMSNPLHPLNPLNPVWHVDDTESVVEVKSCDKACMEKRQFEADLSLWLIGGVVVFSLIFIFFLHRK